MSSQPQRAPGTAQYRVVRHIGDGGLGSVDEIEIITSLLAELPVGCRLARKRLNAKWNAQPVYRERFEREIAALCRMSHPNIIACKGENLPGGERFYVMPLYPCSLRDSMDKHGKRDWRIAARFVAKIADALAYAHGEGFVHRDLKPENILLTPDGGPVIADWGLGYFVHKDSKVLQKLTRAGLGTEYYCSLEQWSNGKGAGTSDTYSLGMTLAELAHGGPVELAHIGAGVTGDTVPPVTVGAVMFNDVIKTMTAVWPTQRYQTMADVARALRYAADTR